MSRIFAYFLGVLIVFGGIYYLGNKTKVEDASETGSAATSAIPSESDGAASETANQTEAPGSLVELDLREPLPDLVLGDVNAPVTVIEYANFTCTHCGDFARQVLPKIKEAYIDTGKVRWIHREVIVDSVGLLATLAARCLPADKYYGMVELLYQNQEAWAYSQTEATGSRAELAKYAALAGVSKETLDQCFIGLDDENNTEARKHIEDIFNLSKERISNDNVTGTPTIFVNGKVIENWAFESLSADIDAALNAE